MNLNLFILCVVLSQEIIGTFSIENITESSDLLVRKKRVLNMNPGEDVPVTAGDFNYVVNILLHDVAHCVGSILSLYTVITSLPCALEDISAYKVMSGSVDIYRGSPHNVRDKKIRTGIHSRIRTNDGIALFIVHPHFSRRIAIVELHVALILTGSDATVLGWGCYYHTGVRGTNYPKKLRSITVPIMPHRECVNTYRGFYDINDEDICIYDPNKHCGLTDGGAPLIINGELAGVYLKRAENHRLRPSPEIFVVLQHARYSQWIRDNIVH